MSKMLFSKLVQIFLLLGEKQSKIWLLTYFNIYTNKLIPENQTQIYSRIIYLNN